MCPLDCIEAFGVSNENGFSLLELLAGYRPEIRNQVCMTLNPTYTVLRGSNSSSYLTFKQN